LIYLKVEAGRRLMVRLLRNQVPSHPKQAASGPAPVFGSGPFFIRHRDLENKRGVIPG
jgi:hypothetical protein